MKKQFSWHHPGTLVPPDEGSQQALARLRELGLFCRKDAAPILHSCLGWTCLQSETAKRVGKWLDQQRRLGNILLVGTAVGSRGLSHFVYFAPDKPVRVPPSIMRVQPLPLPEPLPTPRKRKPTKLPADGPSRFGQWVADRGRAT